MRVSPLALASALLLALPVLAGTPPAIKPAAPPVKEQPATTVPPQPPKPPADAQPQRPNLYELAGSNIKVSYSTSSLDGKPRFSYNDGQSTLSFAGDQIRVVETEVGTLVSVSIRKTIDSGSTTFSILVPVVNLAGDPSSTVHAMALTTVHRYSPVPAFNRGQLENYTTITLTGTAKRVVF